MEKVISVEIIAFSPSLLYHCVDCETVWREIETTPHTHLEQAVANLPPDLAYEFREVSEWIAELLDRYPGQIHLRIIDAISVEGVAKSKQYGINFYPAIIVDHHFVFSEGMLNQAAIEIDRIIGELHTQPSH
jgi:hypothetical protein